MNKRSQIAWQFKSLTRQVVEQWSRKKTSEPDFIFGKSSIGYFCPVHFRDDEALLHFNLIVIYNLETKSIHLLFERASAITLFAANLNTIVYVTNTNRLVKIDYDKGFVNRKFKVRLSEPIKDLFLDLNGIVTCQTSGGIVRLQYDKLIWAKPLKDYAYVLADVDELRIIMESTTHTIVYLITEDVKIEQELEGIGYRLLNHAVMRLLK